MPEFKFKPFEYFIFIFLKGETRGSEMLLKLMMLVFEQIANLNNFDS